MSTMRLVQKALREARVPFKAATQGHIIFIFCPLHDDRKSPSCALYPETAGTRFYCFGCLAHGGWEDLQKVLKLSDLPKDWEDPLACSALHREIVGRVQRDPLLPPLVRPWQQGTWRRLRQETLSLVNSLWWYDEIDRTRRIVWPIWYRDGSLVGWSGRALDTVNEGVPKYRHMSRMDVLSVFWPLPLSGGGERVAVIVEGIVDALRLLQQGIPALANMGCNWSKSRSTHLAMMGIERVICALDGDDAGHKGNLKILHQLKWQYPTDSIGVWEWSAGSDPGDAPIAEIRELRRFTGHQPGLHPWLRALPKPSSQWFATPVEN